MPKSTAPRAGGAKPRGRSPVIAGRVPSSLHQKIKRAAKVSGRSMSEELAWRAEQSFQAEWVQQFERQLRNFNDEMQSIASELLKKAAERIAEHETRIAELENAQQRNEEMLGRIIEAAVARALASREKLP